MKRITIRQAHRFFLVLLTSTLYACGGGSNSSSDKETPTIKQFSVSGRVTFDLVNHDTSTSGLDYNSIIEEPVRGATIQLIKASTINTSPKVLGTVSTNEDGDYHFNKAAPNGENVIVRVLAELDSDISNPTLGSAWFTQVIDNTNGDALYAMDSVSYEVDGDIINLNLHADSGWGVSSYSHPRVAAPFAILNGAYMMIEKLRLAKK